MRLIEKALSVSAKKKCPKKFSLSNGSADFYHVEIHQGTDEFLAMPENIKDQKLPVRKLDGETYIAHRDLDITTLSNSSIKITHYFKTAQFIYHSAGTFLLAHYLRLSALDYQIMQWRENGWQKSFNRKNLIIKDRIEVLDAVLTMHLAGQSQITTLDLITKVHRTHRWLRHPDRPEVQRRYELLLQSWASEGSLEDKNGIFRVKPQALASLDQIQRDERRHSDMKKLTARLVLFTGLLVAIGLLQAGTTMLKP